MSVPWTTSAPGLRRRRTRWKPFSSTCSLLSTGWKGALTRTVAPFGWSIAQLLQPLTYDDEIFWVNAILGADEHAVGVVQDGWSVPVTSGADAVATCRLWAQRSDAVLASLDLDEAPR